MVTKPIKTGNTMIEDTIIARAICCLLPLLAISLGGLFAWLDSRRYRRLNPHQFEDDNTPKIK